MPLISLPLPACLLRIRKYVGLGMFIIVLQLSTLILYETYLYKIKTSILDFIKSPRIDSDTILFESSNERLIDTPGCFLPKTAISPKHFPMKKDNKADCSFEKRLVSIDDASETISLIAGEHIADGCTVIDIERNVTKDWFAYGEEAPLTKKFDISGKERFATKCGKYINFDAHFPVNAEIREKVDHWKNKEPPIPNPNPISVLFMGFDTTSRSHFHRSLVKTLPLMKSMGFVDFKGYHSVAPFTLQNFLVFLMGMTTQKVRASCSANWTTPFDKCPLILKTFSLKKYITMFIEDGAGSFNWGGQGGFQNSPADYYPHPLFPSAQAHREQHGHWFSFLYDFLPTTIESEGDTCMSTLNVQNFILDYTLRFLKKFGNTPFFTLSWFAYPFHGSTYALHGFDEEFFQFFQFLNSAESEKLRENTLIILNADHGERHGVFAKMGYEGFIERSLPGLFIRLPENLLKRYPDLNATQNFQINSGRLVGGLDIHHTLLHLLQLQGLDLDSINQTAKFEPVLPDRSSLFVPLSEHRTCDNISVYKGNCVCNTTSQSTSIDNPFFAKQLVNFALKELNTKITSSKYRRVCATHGKPLMSFMSASVVAKTDTYTDAVLRFITDQKIAQFEVQLRVFHHGNGNNNNATTVTDRIERMERTGPFNRLNSYGNDSWCVEFVTDEDKEMKEICICEDRGGETKDPNRKFYEDAH